MSKPVFDDLFAFHGRRNRKSYALLNLALYGFGVSLGLIILILDEALGGTGATAAVLIVVLVLLISIISLITSAQRCRDAGFSGFAALLLCLPYAGTAAWVAMLVWPGDEGKNKFGEDPRGARR
ncbi:hypothetical protein LCGC14_0408310 [marine sediment metagenome]|uniref:DUF805 domain-containing protein n=2 Tax=root TaxID=1 RepID=A0A7V1FNZ5_9RHOB|nr:DUF805 domain-containing protein [Sulfitobacter litoralis]HDZ53027.1 DUF805 domain-containing protein [Sulfitobacter litoralis]